MMKKIKFYHKYEEVEDTEGELDVRIWDEHLLHIHALWLHPWNNFYMR